MKRVALALIAVVGCADDESGSVERGNVTVHVLRDELAVQGADIVFHDAYGRVLGTARSNELGLATAEITAGGMVTVLDPDFAQRLTTITRVGIGTTLEIPLTPVQAVGSRINTITIDAPTTPAPDETADYVIQTPCGAEGATSLPMTIALPAGCGPGSPIVIIARTLPQNLEDPGRSLAYIATKIGPDSRARPLAWSTHCEQVALDADVQMSLQLWPRFGNHAFRWLDLGFCGNTAPAQPTLDFSEGVVAHAVAYIDGSSQRTSSVLRDFMTLPSALQITSADLLSGSIDAIDFDGKGASWTSDPSLADADLIDATLSWLVAPTDYVVWRVVLAPDALGTYVPDVPEALDMWGTLDGATDVTLELRYADASWLDDLAAVHRELPLMLGGATSQREIPRGSSLREFVRKLYPN
jgi:hypothetical protein